MTSKPDDSILTIKCKNKPSNPTSLADLVSCRKKHVTIDIDIFHSLGYFTDVKEQELKEEKCQPRRLVCKKGTPKSKQEASHQPHLNPVLQHHGSSWFFFGWSGQKINPFNRHTTNKNKKRSFKMFSLRRSLQFFGSGLSFLFFLRHGAASINPIGPRPGSAFVWNSHGGFHSHGGTPRMMVYHGKSHL